MTKTNYSWYSKIFFTLLLLSLSGNFVLAQTGTIKGKVTDTDGKSVPFVNVIVINTNVGGVSDNDGNYMIKNVPTGSGQLKTSVIGYRSVTKDITIKENETLTIDFKIQSDALNLNEVVVTGVVAPLSKMESTVAISTLTPKDLEQMNPRSTTEMLRTVPGFTRVESSGGEVNENISMRGILGVEYVMFMEDGLPVFPTMHTFFMNADNLFRPDLNIQKVEVVRGGNSALFGSNTPGAIINFINNTGGTNTLGTMRITTETMGLARYDFDVNGPLNDVWRFNVGGFYRYDRGVRDPGFPGISGGQLKANVTRLMDNGYVRFSAKYINDRNQFILDLPFQNPGNPTYVPGFGNYGSMNTNEGDNISVPTPDGRLNLPLDHGLQTNAYWLTGDIGLNFAGGWEMENHAQIMSNAQEWNAIVPADVMSVNDYLFTSAGVNLAPGTNYRLTYTNHFDATGANLPYNEPNGLIAPGGEWHVEKPMTAFQDQFQVKKQVDKSTFSLGLYMGNYSQTNRWYFTDILTDVENNPKFLDLQVINSNGTVTNYTKNGFRNLVSLYVNGSGTATIFSGVLAASIQFTDHFRADLGIRYEWDNFSQDAENTSNVKLSADTLNLYDNETWGNNSYRHFTRSIADWAGSIGLNYTLTDEWAIYVQAGRAYKMPALDEYLNATAQDQVNLFSDRQIITGEAGIKYSTPILSFTLDGFETYLKNIIGQGAVTDPVTKRTTWIITTSPENRSYGAEAEVSLTPVVGLNFTGNGTFLKAELSSGAGADIGSWINGVPKFIGNLSGTYEFFDFTLLADWHYVDTRFVDFTVGTTLPSYSYFNFGLGYKVPGTGLRLNADLLNATQSIGLEEGNPRKVLFTTGATNLFLARPILPTRFSLAATYNF